MWCRECRQDVPALPSGDARAYCCPRCGEILSSEGTVGVAYPQAAIPTATECEKNIGDEISFPGYDSWDLEQQLREFEYALYSSKQNDSTKRSPGDREIARIDRPHNVMASSHFSGSKPKKEKELAGLEKPDRKAATGSLTWPVIALGTGSFVCGGILLGWSLITGRQELWDLGLPATLLGQVALLIGLLLYVERLWHGYREATDKLEHVDQQLHELKNTTTLLGVSNGPLSTTFYSHFVGGASPHLLLTDLKAQLDLLAMKLAREDKK